MYVAEVKQVINTSLPNDTVHMNFQLELDLLSTKFGNILLHILKATKKKSKRQKCLESKLKDAGE